MNTASPNSDSESVGDEMTEVISITESDSMPEPHIGRTNSVLSKEPTVVSLKMKKCFCLFMITLLLLGPGLAISLRLRNRVRSERLVNCTRVEPTIVNSTCSIQFNPENDKKVFHQLCYTVICKYSCPNVGYLFRNDSGFNKKEAICDHSFQTFDMALQESEKEDTDNIFCYDFLKEKQMDNGTCGKMGIYYVPIFLIIAIALVGLCFAVCGLYC